MSEECRIEFVNGELTCLCNHRDYRNCDLYEDCKKRIFQQGGRVKIKIIEIRY